MPQIEIQGFEELIEAFKDISEIPQDVKDNILTSMGDVAADAIKKKGESYGVRSDDPDSQHLLDNIRVAKPKYERNCGYVDVKFRGRKPRKGKHSGAGNGFIAFLVEFGNNGIPARPFINDAMVESTDKIIETGQEIFDKFLDETY